MKFSDIILSLMLAQMLLMMVIGVLSLINIYRVESAFNGVVKSDLPSALLISKMTANLLEQINWVERGMLAQPTPEQQAELLRRLDAIEQQVNTIKMPLPFADQVYVLRQHISFVRERLAASAVKA